MSISPGERLFVRLGCEADIRNDGRRKDDLRAFTIETGTVPSATGSARFRQGKTDILAVVKAEIGTPDVAAPDEGIVNFAVECSANMLGTIGAFQGTLGGFSTGMSGPDSTGRRDLEALGKLLGSQLSAIYHEGGAIRRKRLCIIPGRKCWILNIDCVVFSTDGNLVDALALAVRAALRTSMIPAVSVVRIGGGPNVADSTTAAADDDDSVDVGSEWRKKRGTATTAAEVKSEMENRLTGSSQVTLHLAGSADEWDAVVNEDPAAARCLARWDRDFPLVITLNKVGKVLIADATQEEESCAISRVSVALDDKERILGTFKTGTAAISPQAILEAIAKAAEIARNLRAMFNRAYLAALGLDESNLAEADMDK